MSQKKEVKVQKKNEVKFDFKEKGSKPIVTKEILQFAITGEDFNVDELGKLLSGEGVEELE